VVVDNGSKPESVTVLQGFRAHGMITKLILEPINHFFSEGNNIGVRHSNPESKYILLLNNDTEIFRPDWLSKMVQWMEGVPEILPYTWSDHPAEPSPSPRDIVAIGWSYDKNVPGYVRPEGWCCMIRRTFWRELSPDFPFHSGTEEMLASIMRDGGKCGSLCQYAKYIRHYEGGSRTSERQDEIINKRTADYVAWFKDTMPESLDFTLGPHESASYVEW
jgi:glycosyltransferase involved in cell wall biosynthesis